ncbi:collagen alpha-3(IV) chain [Fopius arisanus]|uniref:Collagen alpha-3(IV) chain n=1 Tax=Fopius arisanus TaxID=64838 RepID=A0A0C9R6U9_9HYME|nr:PREDICTED: collagen alpha-3(IV) chain-like [Fopius arisanus]
MIKTVIIGCLCALIVVEAQHEGPPHKPPGPPGSHGPSTQLNRIARQAPPGDNGPIPQGMNGGMGPGNLGMQGLGNIPDPTVWIAKGQEIASQFAKGRRRRQIPAPKMPDGMPPMPPMPKMNY